MATYTFETTDAEEAGISDAKQKAGGGVFSNAEYIEATFRSAVTSWVRAASVTVTLSADMAAKLTDLLNDPKVVFDEEARAEVLRQVSPVGTTSVDAIAEPPTPATLS